MNVKTICVIVLLYIVFLKYNIINYFKLNNSCPTYFDYYYMWFNKNCYYEPDVFSSTTEILKRHIGFFETYEVETEDGFYLTLFRIPKKNPKGIMVLVHPLSTDSVVYVGQSNSSMAFVMSEAGYEVWLTNNRGTYYSMKHKHLKPSSFEYWDFSFNEIALYDYPANLNFIKNKTNRNDLIFVGHSLSTTCGLVYSSMKSAEALNTVKIFIHMSPSAYHKHTTSILKYLAPLEPILMPLSILIHKYSIGSPSGVIATFYHLLVLEPIKQIIVKSTQLFTGFSGNEFDLNLINLLCSLNPRAASMKLFSQYAQDMNADGRFQMYDYGKEKNLELYNSTIPPEYPVENILVPTYLMASNDDSLATVADAEFLYGKLRKEAKIYGKYFFDGLNHVDFMYGKDRKEKLYEPILKLLNKIR